MLNKKTQKNVNYTPKNKHKKPILPLLLFPQKVKNTIKADVKQKTLRHKLYTQK